MDHAGRVGVDEPVSHVQGDRERANDQRIARRAVFERPALDRGGERAALDELGEDHRRVREDADMVARDHV